MTQIFYDSLCYICSTEIAFLRRVDKESRVKFTDISDPDFHAERYGKSIDDFIGSIHGIDRNGRMIEGMEVFREVYTAVGLGWIMNWTGWPLIRPATDLGYRLFARIRPRLSRFKGQKPVCEENRCHRS